jgi:hypothetical protein
VVVAALVAAQSATAPPVQKPAPRAAPPPPAAAVHPVPVPAAVPVHSHWVRLDLGGTAGSESRDSALRFGGLGRFGIAFAPTPVFAFASGAYTVRRAGTPNISWLTGSLGFGVRVGFARQRAALELRSELVVESLSISASDGQRVDSAHRIRLGPRLGLDLSGYLTKDLALVAGAEAGGLGPQVVIEVRGEPSERLSTFAWGFISALRYDFR